MFNKKVELPMPILFILLSLAILAYCTTIPRKEAAFLYIISIIILVSSSSLLVTTLKLEISNVNLEDVNLHKIFIILAALSIYALALSSIGYIPCTLLLGIFIIRILGYKYWFKNILFCILVTALTFSVFRLILGVPLPMGLPSIIGG